MLTTLLMLSPALALLALLLTGRAPGEELILRLRKRTAAPTRRRATATSPLAAPDDTRLLRPLGRMSASALAMRPPPLLATSYC